MKKQISLILAAVVAVGLTACGSSADTSAAASTETPASASEETPTATPEPTATPVPVPDLSGTWTQVNHDTSYQEATINGDSMQIDWVADDGTRSLYWAGTFTAPTTADEPYVWTSNNDTTQTSVALLASSDATKDFTYENGVITYEVSMMGTTATMQLEKTSDETADIQATATSFADGTLTTGDYTITITDYKVIQPGETGNEYSEKPVIAFWYDTTNTGDEAYVDPMTAWIMVFEAVQDNDPNAVNTLNVASLPDEQFLDSQMQNIKPGGTVANAVAYELDDDTTPVELTARDIMGNAYGSQTYEIAQ